MKDENNSSNFDLVCFSHLRWDFVYQRPQHLLSRFAKERRVFFIEEPVFVDQPSNLNISPREDYLYVIVPHISHSDRENEDIAEVQRKLINRLFLSQNITNFVAWFYTPMALPLASQLKPTGVVYDCMDELSGFKFAPPELLENERSLFEKADLVFTGGQSLYEAKKSQHSNVHAFPSSIDAAHFEKARTIESEPEDQKQILHPRLGYCGVIDERMNIELLGQMADLRPDWQFIMIGPVVKIADEDLPHRQNIHYLGGKNYNDLPNYLAGWDVALMPFALNESTKFISPTKTPEYLAAGLPVVSTPIQDVVQPYGSAGLVQIASTAEEFVTACEKELENDAKERQPQVDDFLAQNSWDKTWLQMSELIKNAVESKSKAMGV